jgi:hypothetical protein
MSAATHISGVSMDEHWPTPIEIAEHLEAGGGVLLRRHNDWVPVPDADPALWRRSKTDVAHADWRLAPLVPPAALGPAPVPDLIPEAFLHAA